MRQNVPGGVLILTMHPQVIGRGHRMLFLERIIEYMSENGANFARMADFVYEWKSNKRPSVQEQLS